jgi:hypothetical protein
MKLDLTKYPNIQKLKEVYKIKEGLWFAYGEKNGQSSEAYGRSRKDALETLELHLSYVI